MVFPWDSKMETVLQVCTQNFSLVQGGGKGEPESKLFDFKNYVTKIML
jgi:hypothetical protein